MLVHQSSDPSSLSILQCLNDRVMLTMRRAQIVVHPWQVHIIECNSAGRRER